MCGGYVVLGEREAEDGRELHVTIIDPEVEDLCQGYAHPNALAVRF